MTTPSFAARWAAARLRSHVKPRLAAVPDLAAATQILEGAFPASRHEAPLGRLGGADGDWFETPGARATLLYLHGGAFFAGSPALYRSITRAFAARGFNVFAPAYRLAPAHPFPAAVEDAHAAYDALACATGGGIVVAGDSAGGGLALALMIALRDDGARLPRAAALFSPWTDLAVTGASARENEGADALFTRKMLKIAARNYLAGASAREASPLFADLRGLPPLLLHVGANELLRDDSTRLFERAKAAGVSTELEIWPGVPHGWQLGAGAIPEADASLDAAAAFLLASR